MTLDSIVFEMLKRKVYGIPTGTLSITEQDILLWEQFIEEIKNELKIQCPYCGANYLEEIKGGEQ